MKQCFSSHSVLDVMESVVKVDSHITIALTFTHTHLRFDNIAQYHKRSSYTIIKGFIYNI